MPLLTKTVQTPSTVVTGFKCNCCGLETNDVFDTQEMLYWQHHCGYNSTFGDGNTIELVLCQYCVQNILGNYLTSTNL